MDDTQIDIFYHIETYLDYGEKIALSLVNNKFHALHDSKKKQDLKVFYSKYNYTLPCLMYNTAMENGYIDIMIDIIRTKNLIIDEKSFLMDDRLLSRATLAGDIYMIRFLIHYGLDPNDCNETSGFPAIFLCIQGYDGKESRVRIIKELTKNIDNIESLTIDNKRRIFDPVEISLLTQCTDVVEFFIRHKGLQINKRRSLGANVVHYVVPGDITKTIELMQLLIDNGADINCLNNHYKTPIDYFLNGEGTEQLIKFMKNNGAMTSDELTCMNI